MYNVIIPTYNEANNILPLLNILRDIFKSLNIGYKFIVVDDNSPDNTSKIAKSWASNHLEVIDRPSKLGLGSAYAAALDHCEFEHTIILDADLQHDPTAIIEMNGYVNKGYDIVTGTRYDIGGMVCNWSFMRCLISSFANNLARFTLGLKSTDLTGSFRIYKTSILKEIVSESICKGFGFQMEAITRAEFKKYKIAEVPIVFYDRAAGTSKMSVKEAIYFFSTVVNLYLKL